MVKSYTLGLTNCQLLCEKLTNFAVKPDSDTLFHPKKPEKKGWKTYFLVNIKQKIPMAYLLYFKAFSEHHKDGDIKG